MKVVGLYYRPQAIQMIAQYLKGGERFRLERESDNRYDPNAIKVILDSELPEDLAIREEVHLGYIPASECQFFEGVEFPIFGTFTQHIMTESGAIHLDFELV